MGASGIVDHLVPIDGGPARARARSWLDRHGFPTRRDEAWRDTPVDEVLSRLAAAVPARPVEVSRHDVDRLAGDHGGLRLVVVNGAHRPALSDARPSIVGLWCGPGDGPDEDGTGRDRPDEDGTDEDGTDDGPGDDGGFGDGFRALNRAAGADPLVVTVAPGVVVPHPVHLVHLAAPDDPTGVAHPRAVISVGRGSRLDLIESFVGFAGPALTNASTTIVVADRGEVTHHRVQAEAFGATHIGHTRVVVASGSRYAATSLMLGGDIARHALDVTLAGPGARAELTGLYRPAGHQRFDTSVRVDHAASRGTSTQRFKGVVADHATGSFSGHVVVRPGTVATDARQTNPNLVLARTARADSRPWLEIFADDVRCTHGSTVGRLDEDALFYLRSRGIPRDEGRALLIDAFTREITDAVEPRSLRDHVVALARAGSEEHRP